ncbi:transposase [Streptococcus danieliae]|uniref:Transposase n=1 Tax=Streptococcus danieliae TaxID=747656 RepID=A0A7X3KCA2_9STRE|nr:transposase [Streptococcus danieliae]
MGQGIVRIPLFEPSLSAPGVPYDNAVSERTYRSFKTEFIKAYKFESLEQLALLTQDYIHWWNHKRRHSTLNNLSLLRRIMVKL